MYVYDVASDALIIGAIMVKGTNKSLALLIKYRLLMRNRLLYETFI